jgi:hypothetical protein
MIPAKGQGERKSAPASTDARLQLAYQSAAANVPPFVYGRVSSRAGLDEILRLRTAASTTVALRRLALSVNDCRSAIFQRVAESPRRPFHLFVGRSVLECTACSPWGGRPRIAFNHEQGLESEGPLTKFAISFVIPIIRVIRG